MRSVHLPSGNVVNMDLILSFVRSSADIVFTKPDASTFSETFASAAIATSAMQRIINFIQSGGTAGSITIFNAIWSVISATPNSGAAAGGTSVDVVGFLFSPWHQVYFGANSAASQIFVDSTKITAVTPAHVAGAVDVRVVDGSFEAAPLVGGYTYV